MIDKNIDGKQMLSFRIPWKRLGSAAASQQYAMELTHPLYRYPAMMSPYIARILIQNLTQPGDIILDPFCGGGTTAIEALSNGRNVICSDLNPLACFVTRAKATPLNSKEILTLKKWVCSAQILLHNWRNIHPIQIPQIDRPFVAPKTRSLIYLLKDTTVKIKNAAVRHAAMLLILRIAQLSFDASRKSPSPLRLVKLFDKYSNDMIRKMQFYSSLCNSRGMYKRPLFLDVIKSDANNLNQTHFGINRDRISLILTSPPYPGVHVLYHRWQIDGRKETSLPYEILGIHNGFGPSHFTLGPRHDDFNEQYFQRLIEIYARLRNNISHDFIVAQIVAFPKPQYQLNQFRSAMNKAGYLELNNFNNNKSIVREVPHRRWYTYFSPCNGSSKEFLLLHHPKRFDGGFEITSDSQFRLWTKTLQGFRRR